jgi:predicted  nucleic acid-binding Zn-ribbon protein
MNADLEHLVVLQAQDLELKRLRQELAEAPRRVAAAEAARAKSEAALTAAKSALLKEETLRRSQEVDIAERRTKIARLRKQMETAANAAQIAALEHEIQFSEEAIAKLEDEELASMERTEQQEAAKSAAAKALEENTATLATERASGVALVARNDAAIVAIEAERKSLRAKIAESSEGEAALSNYDRIAKAKGTGLSEAVDHKCSACQMMVRPQRWNDLIGREHDHVIFTCETCGRMLFWDPRRDSPVRWAAGEKLVGSKPTSTEPQP